MIRCFKCNGLGHIGANCPGKGVGGILQDESKGKNKGKSQGKKGKGFARKGKLNEVYDSSHFFFFFLHCRTSARLGRSTTGVSL